MGTKKTSRSMSQNHHLPRPSQYSASTHASNSPICTIMLQLYKRLMVHVLPSKAETAVASNNITRCTLSAVALAVLQPLKNSIGDGWMFTSIGLVDGILSIIEVSLLQKWVWSLARTGNNRDGDVVK